MSDPSVHPNQKTVPPEVLELARGMLLAGQGWNAIGRATGFDPYTIRSRLDPDYAKRRLAEIRAAQLRRGYPGPGRATLAGVVFRVPPDTRSRMARFFGDPPPGRSALDQRGRQ